MLNNNRKFNLKSFIQIIISLILILLMIQLSSIEFLTIDTASGISNWTENSKHQFEKGTFHDTQLLDNGTIELAKQVGYIEDDFENELKIGLKKSLIVDNADSNVKMLKLLETYHSGGHDYGRTVHPTDDGGYLIAGWLYYYGGNAYNNAWVIKTNYKGEMEWDKEYGSGYDDSFDSILKTTDGCYLLTGWYTDYPTTNRDLFLVKIDDKGNEKWTRTLGGNELDAGYGAVETSDDGFLIIGVTESYGAGGFDIWLVKTTSLGYKQWDKTFGDLDDESGVEIIQTSDGGYIILGSKTPEGTFKSNIWLIKTDSTGNMLWNTTFGGVESDSAFSVQETTDGGYIFAGSTGSYSSGLHDVWLIKTDKDGEKQWSRVFGAGGSEGASEVRQTSDGGYIIAGTTSSFGSGSFDGWLIKTNGNGNKQWDKVIGGEGDDRFWDMEMLPDGGFIMTGFTTSYDSYDENFWLVRTDDQGNVNPVGLLVSENLLEGHKVSPVKTFSYNASVPSGCKIKVQFSKDNSTWYNSYGNKDQYDFLNNGEKTINLRGMDWSGSKFFYRMYFHANDASLPELNAINISYKIYHDKGSYESQHFDTNGFQKWKGISSKSMIPEGSTIKFQFRTAKTEEELSSKDYLGPDGSTETYYITSGEALWDGHDEDSWAQFQAYFLRIDTSRSPILKDVTISFNYLPSPPKLIGPVNNTYIKSLNPTFEWKFSDQDSTEQSGFQWQADDSNDFTSVVFDSGKVSLKNSSYQSSEYIPNGIWYWRVRTQDSDGDWGPFSNTFILKTDRAIDKPLNISVEPSDWSSRNLFIIDWTNPIDASGIKPGAYYYIGYSPPASPEDGYWTPIKPIVIRNIPEGEHKIYFWLEDLAGNYDHLEYGNATLRCDETAPTIEHQQITQGTQMIDITFSAKVIDTTSGVKNVTLYFKDSKSPSYSTLPMTGKNDTYSTTILGETIITAAIQYHLKTVDFSEPPNVKYFGKDGEVTDEFSSDNDIEILISKTPIIIDKKPTGNNVSVSAQISATFNELMDHKTTEEAFSVFPNVKGEFYWKGNKLLFTPSKYLKYNTTYQVTITKSAIDNEGNSLGKDIKWSFTTQKGSGTDNNRDSSNSADSNNLLIISIIGIIIVSIIISLILYSLILKKKKKMGNQVINYQQQTIGPNSSGITVAQTTPIIPTAPTTPTIHQPLTNLYINTSVQAPTSQVIYQQPQTLQIYKCELCNAQLLDPNKCPYCGWVRQSY